MFVDASLIIRIIDVVTGFGVDAMLDMSALVDVDRNVGTGVVSALEFPNSEPVEGFSC